MKDILGLPSAKSVTWHHAKVGDRQTTSTQARKIKEEQGFRCNECGKKFPEWQLQIHHKKGISKHKNPLGDMPIYALGHKPKLKYERRSNKVAICIPCHNKTKRKKTTKSKNMLPSFNNLNIPSLK
ncbi:MAG: hypothetical protein V1815_00010 [Candidatus Woesearchaeota archaeon]